MSETQTERASAPETHRFEAEVEQVLRLVVHSLYSNKDIFLRELLSNASDALDKRRFRALTEPALASEGEMKIRLEVDAANKTLTISDDGIGMTHDELVQHLGTIAKSGTRELADRLKKDGGTADLNLIGQFGVGFYSAFLVADRVDVLTRAAGQTSAYRWSSDAKSSFTIEPADRATVGTSVVLHLREDSLELLRTWKLEELVRSYSDYLSWPIEVRLEREGTDTAPEWRRINRATAIWQRSPSEVTEEQYEEFYSHVSHDFGKPLAHKHFKVEGTQEFRGLLYIPRNAPFDLFAPDSKHGIRLYVKRVFILEDGEQILPRWLRFVRGVLDSEDLPLNVSRELLQDSKTTKVMRKQVVKQIIDLLTEMAAKKPEDYAHFWSTFGPVLKEGLHYEPEHAEKLSKLLRFRTTHSGEGTVSLSEYKARMKEGQSAIYYLLGESERQLASSPHLEALRARDYEVLYLTDSVDAFAIPALTEFDGVKLEAAASANLDVAASGSESAEEAGDFRSLRDRIRARLQDRVSEVRVSKRLVDSPACLVVPEGGLPPHLERLLRASQKDVPATKRILEINPNHPLIGALRALSDDAGDAPLDEWIEVLFAQAQIAEGGVVEDPGLLAKRLGALLTEVATRSAKVHAS